MLHDKIGKQGEYAPKLTVCGAVAKLPFYQRIGLGDGYYCVGDLVPSPRIDTQTIINDLRALVPDEGSNE